MNKVLMTAVAAIALSGAAWAQSALDADGDGAVTLEEAQAVSPELTAEAFAALDTDANGTLDADEVAAAQAAGQLPGDDAAETAPQN